MKAELKPEELAPQLRLGNLLIRPTINKDNASETIDLIMPVSHVDIRDAVHYGKDWNAKPIELSEEWLLKAGYRQVNGWRFHTDDYIIDKMPLSGKYIFRVRISETESIQVAEMRYVHTFQNLTHALTGNELIFNHG